ncbi:MAG: hypothetical protein WCF78_01350 [archaeon]
MKKTIFFVLLLIIAIIGTPIINAEKISESTFLDLGYADFSIDKGNSDCKSYTLTGIELNVDATYVLQLKIANYIPLNEQDNVSIKVYLNNALITEIKNQEIKERNLVELKGYKDESLLSVCVDNNFIPRMVISKYTVVGSYLLPIIKKEDFYQVVPEKVYKNTLTPVEIFVKNSGIRDVTVTIFNASKEFSKNSTLDNVSGDTTFEGIIKAGETKNLKYFIKTSDQTNYVTPRATLKYISEFGDEITMYTEQEQIKIDDLQTKLDISVEINREITTKIDAFGKIILRNVSEDDLQNIYIVPKFDGTIEVYNPQIARLDKKEVMEIQFKVNTVTSKDHDLSFNIYYDTPTESNKSVGSQKITVTSVPEDNTNTQIIAVLIAITIVLFIWIFKF